MKLHRVFVFCLLLLIISACSAVRIQTGPPTEKQATQTSEERGQGLRSQWADQLSRVQPKDKMFMVQQFVDSTGALLIRIGGQIADQWRQGETGRGREIPPDEMRGVIEASVRTDQPLLEAYDDMVDYGVNEVRHTNFFDEETMRYLLELRSQYDKIHGEVLYPDMSRIDYEDNLQALQIEAERLSTRLRDDLYRY